MQQTTSVNPRSPSLPAPAQPSVRLPHVPDIAWPYLRPLLPIVLFTVVLWLLHHEFSDYRLELFGGTPVVVRLYTAWGMSPPEIVRLVIFIGLAFWLGYTNKKATESGLRFEMVARANVATMLPTLKKNSDTWHRPEV